MDESKAVYKQVLERAGYGISDRGGTQFYFEDDSLMGVVFVYQTVTELLEAWSNDQRDFLKNNATRLRDAPEKTWNLYCVFLTPSDAIESDEYSVSQIEEDFRATRKVAKTGVATAEDALVALLPLLPLQNEVSLGVPDIQKELKDRLELSAPAWEALFNRRDAKLLARILAGES